MAFQYSGKATAGDVVALPQALLDVYSADVEYNSLEVLRYEEVFVMKDELRAVPGQAIKFTTYDDIAIGGELTEHTNMETKNTTASQVTHSVKEYGNAVGITEALLIQSFDDEMAKAVKLLGRDYARTRNKVLRDILTGSGSTLFTTTGASALNQVLASDVFDIETLRNAVEELEGSDCPKFFDDYYVCFIHTHQKAHLTRDPDWIDAHRYADMRALYNGEIGRWQNVVFIQTNAQPNGAAATTKLGYDAALDGTGAGSQDLYRATIVGDYAAAVADVLPVELRDDGIKNFGRFHDFAWYAQWACGVLNSDHIVHIVSS